MRKKIRKSPQAGLPATPVSNRSLSLRTTDQETARVVAVHRPNGDIAGSGCLLDGKFVLTCRHVVAAALNEHHHLAHKSVLVTLAGVSGSPTVEAQVKPLQNKQRSVDLALLEITEGPPLAVSPVEFASPLRHSGKRFSVLGFPHNDQQGRNVSGTLHAVDTRNLVQMDCASPLLVEGGFSGAPVWSPDLGAFVGLVVTALYPAGVAWCIPSRVLCRFYNDLLVRFRIPPEDRPIINDYDSDDPNASLFGTISDNGERRLTASITKRENNWFTVKARYESLQQSPPARGGFVTFITFPDFKSARQDKYELFAALKDGCAQATFDADGIFTLAAIGDAGDTALTLNLSDVSSGP